MDCRRENRGKKLVSRESREERCSVVVKIVQKELADRESRKEGVSRPENLEKILVSRHESREYPYIGVKE